MEEEIRFYYNYNQYYTLLDKLKREKRLKYDGCFFELTIQYDNAIEKMSFYNKNIDGRLRLRSSINNETHTEKSKISWKRRLPDTREGIINKEEEIEVELKPGQIENAQILFEKVLGLKRVESYERYRNVFFNDDIEIVVDKYPFGIALEIENKSKVKRGEDTIKYWANKLNIDVGQAYRLSWDDKYTSLCREQGIKPVKDVLFAQNIAMPKVM